MDFLDFLWNLNQDRQLEDVRGYCDRLRLQQDLGSADLRDAKELAEENLELKLRLGLLVRLLIAKGVITAQEYAALIAEAQSRSQGADPNG